MRILLGVIAAASLLTAGPVASQDKLYKWVDEDGNVSYQDRPPPEGAGQVQTFAGRSGAAPSAALPDVVFYSIKACGACDLVRKLLNERGVPFEEKDAETGAEVQAELEEIAGVLSVPVLTIGDEVLTGYNRELIVNELEEAGFVAGMAVSAPPPAEPEGRQPLTREDLEGMTPEEIQQAARDAASRGVDNDLFEEDEGFATLNEDFFPEDDGPAPDDISELEEIPEDERILSGE